LQVLGFGLGVELTGGIARLGDAPARRPARRVLLLRDRDAAEDARLADDLRRLGAAVHSWRTPPDRIWLDGQDAERAAVPARTFDAAIAWLESRPVGPPS